jgi:hypothetical protein
MGRLKEALSEQEQCCRKEGWLSEFAEGHHRGEVLVSYIFTIP